MGCGLDKAFEIQLISQGSDQHTIGKDPFACKQSRLISLLSEIVSLAVSISCIFDY